MTLPEKLPASIEAKIKVSRHDHRTERYDIYSDFPLTKQDEDEFSRTIVSTGDINGGGDLISLEKLDDIDQWLQQRRPHAILDPCSDLPVNPAGQKTDNGCQQKSIDKKVKDIDHAFSLSQWVE